MISEFENFFIGFPPPLLGTRPVRLAGMRLREDLWVIFKPSGMGMAPELWEPDVPVLMDGIMAQAERGKPEFSRLGIPPTGIYPVYRLEAELAGPTLWTSTHETASELKNALGSDGFEFSFRFVTRGRGGEVSSQFECELPIAPHRSALRALVSHRTGKKSRTVFSFLQRAAGLSLWEAKGTRFRPHQLRLHATESGLPIVGDGTYGGEAPVFLSDLKKGYRRKSREERPLYPGVMAILEAVRFQLRDQEIEVRDEGPPAWKVSMRYLFGWVEEPGQRSGETV